MNVIDTDAYSAQLRARAVDTTRRALLITDLRGSAQEGDLSEPVNCGGYGRIRHFTAAAGHGWPPNPLPAVPAAAALGLPPAGQVRAQVFQNAICNWPCILHALVLFARVDEYQRDLREASFVWTAVLVTDECLRGLDRGKRSGKLGWGEVFSWWEDGHGLPAGATEITSLLRGVRVPG